MQLAFIPLPRPGSGIYRLQWPAFWGGFKLRNSMTWKKKYDSEKKPILPGKRLGHYLPPPHPSCWSTTRSLRTLHVAILVLDACTRVHTWVPCSCYDTRTTTYSIRKLNSIAVLEWYNICSCNNDEPRDGTCIKIRIISPQTVAMDTPGKAISSRAPPANKSVVYKSAHTRTVIHSC